MSPSVRITAVLLVATLTGASLALWLTYADAVTLAYMTDLAMRCF